jgi:lipopolysaccharide heptosyltransferase II
MKDYRRILIIKPSSLGDIVHALPALAALRQRFPKAHIAWLVKDHWAGILADHPDLDEIVATDLALTRWLALIGMLRHGAFDLVVDLQGLFRSGLLGWLTGARERVGFAQAREGSPLFYTRRVMLPNPERRPWRLIDMHAVDRNLAVAAHLGADVSRPQSRFGSSPAADQAIDAVLAKAGVRPDERLVAIAPVDRLRVRSWPLDRFIEVAMALAREPGLRVVLIGGPSERPYAEPFHRAVGEGLIDLMGRTSLPELVAVLRRVNVLLANDSAPIHIAAAVGTSVVGLFGPTSPLKTGPYGEGHVVIRKPIACSPCERRTCANVNQYECLTAIPVQEVVGTTRRLALQAPACGELSRTAARATLT